MGWPRRLGALLCALLRALPALADPAPAYLVEDINGAPDTQAFHTGGPIADVGGITYFVAKTREAGYELWRSDGTQAGTTLVKDIRVGAEPTNTDSQGPRSFVNVNGTLFFIADDGVHSWELWKSDGTSTGTVMVKDINPGTSGSFSSTYTEKLTSLNGAVYFAADDGVHGRELWKSDGTADGTVLVKDLSPGTAPSMSVEFPQTSIGSAGDTLFFSACTTGCTELWKSDGTEAGTVRVRSFSGSLLFELTGVGERLFFWSEVVNCCQSVAQLWTSDGTEAGTIPLGQIGFVDNESPEAIPFYLTNVGGTLFFAATDGVTGSELWKSDGTPAGTVLVKDIATGEGSNPRFLTDVNGVLFFAADEDAFDGELWKSDGTEAGTVRVKDIRPGAAGSMNLENSTFANVNGILFFPADDGTTGEALWRSDGTEAGTVLVKDVQTGSFGSAVYSLTNVGGTLFFHGRDSNNVADLWKSDGTPAGTLKLEGGPSAPTASGLPSAANDVTLRAEVDGTVFFAAIDGTSGQLWKSDGTSAGTVLVKDFGPPSFTTQPSWLTNVNGTLFFRATDPASGTELWKSDGTAAGTVRVKDIFAGAGSSNPRELINVNGILFFNAQDAATGIELWKSDGTDAGTVRVKDIATGTGWSDPRWLTVVNGTLYFVAASASNGRELWKSNGTDAGTVLVSDIVSGTGSSSPLELEDVNDTLYFTVASSPLSGGEGVWKSDGTPSGTVRVSGVVWGPRSLTRVGAALFFTASTNQIDRELWKTDGTGPGTVLVKDVRPGSVASNPQFLTNANGALFFAADDGTHGIELWKSDGTAAGTALVEDILPGPSPSALSLMTPVGSRIVFQANDGISGEELWTSDGTPAGTHLVADVGPIGGSSAEPLAQIGPLLLFSAVTEALGRELYAVPATALADGDGDGLEDQTEIALGTDPDDPDSDDDGLTDGAEVDTYGTNPLDPDSDGDGSSDSAEVAAGTSPLDPGRYPVTVNIVPIGDPGNAPDVTGFGAVAGKIRTAIVEVTVKQYVSFLNAVADTDTYGLFGAIPAIQRTGSSGSYVYSAVAGQEDRPVSFVSFYDALRFINWLENDQPEGPQGPATTEDGAYTITPAGIDANSIARNPSAHFALPTEDEWYKAAYYHKTTHTYLAYPIDVPGAIVCATPRGTANTANCGDAVGDTVNVASYGAVSPNGTLDQGGNVWEWTESISGADRRIRGGGFHSPASELSSANSGLDADPLVEDSDVGFRVPEPARTWQVLAGIGALALLHRRRTVTASARRDGN